MRLPLILAATLALSACVAGPPPEIATPVPDMPVQYEFATDAQTNASLAALLPENDPAFQVFARYALEDAPSLAEAIALVEAARAGARRAGAERLPNIGADASVTANRINPQQFGGDSPFADQIDTEQTSYGANLTASWAPDIFGRLKAQERAAIARIDAADASASAVRNALLSEIAGAVIDWRVLDQRQASIESDLRAARLLAGLAGKREEAGLAPGFDRVRAEATANASMSRFRALASERAQITGRLIALTGKDAQWVATALVNEAPEPTAPPAPASLPSELLTNRPDVLAAASELAATDAELAATARSRFPRFTLSGVIGLLAFDPSDLFDEDSIVGTLAAGVAAPLFDFGRIEAEIDGAAANKKIAFAAYRGAVFQALGDAEAAYGLVAASDRELEAAVQERDLLDRAARLAQTRYEAGLSSFLEVLEARRAADASGERAALARGRAQRARVLLWQALGGTRAAEQP